MSEERMWWRDERRREAKESSRADTAWWKWTDHCSLTREPPMTNNRKDRCKKQILQLILLICKFALLGLFTSAKGIVQAFGNTLTLMNEHRRTWSGAIGSTWIIRQTGCNWAHNCRFGDSTCCWPGWFSLLCNHCYCQSKSLRSQSRSSLTTHSISTIWPYLGTTF